jgi:hypothetical protein
MAKVEFQVANSIIELGAKYTLDYRPDPSAPEGMKGMTKFPFDGNDTVEKVYFHDQRRQFDTGFYEESPCLSIVPSEKKSELVKLYVKHIQVPYEKQFNVKLSPEEANTFWEEYSIKGWVNKQFDTTNINDLLELFYILNMGLACEKDEKNPVLRKDAQFILSSPSKVKNKTKELVKLRKDSYLKFNTLLAGDRDKLDLVLQWIGKENPSKVDSEDLDSIYYQIINDKKDGIAFCEQFLLALEEYETDKGKEKMEWFYGIKRLINLRKIKKTQRGFVTADQEVYLGTTLQQVAAFCLLENSAQFKIVSELLEENPETKRPEHLKVKKV